MQNAGVYVAKHAVAQAVAVEQRTKLNDVIGQMFRRHAGIFRKGNRLGGTFGIPQQPHRFLRIA